MNNPIMFGVDTSNWTAEIVTQAMDAIDHEQPLVNVMEFIGPLKPYSLDYPLIDWEDRYGWVVLSAEQCVDLIVEAQRFLFGLLRPRIKGVDDGTAQ